MATAMSELIDFPSIPVKVTLDEFIEIAKYYSTPGSSTFINGVLGAVARADAPAAQPQAPEAGPADA